MTLLKGVIHSHTDYLFYFKKMLKENAVGYYQDLCCTILTLIYPINNIIIAKYPYHFLTVVNSSYLLEPSNPMANAEMRF